MAKLVIEQQKYKELYDEADSTYGIEKTHGKGIIKFILMQFIPKSLVDVGCGGNLFCELIKGYGIKLDKPIERVAGVDFASNSKKDGIEFYQAFAHDLPFKDNEFDVLTSFDMLEHILPEYIDETLDELDRVSKIAMIFTISHRQVKRGLHNIVESEEWWENKLKKYGEIIRYQKFWIIKNG